jgi:aldehyde dehydrogenase (NAD+)
MATATKQATWTGRNYIDGRWLSDDSRPRFANLNPAHCDFSPPRDEALGHYPCSSAADVDAAVEAARRAQPAWRRTSRIKRGYVMARLAELIGKNIDDLATVLARESGKIFDEARAEVVEGLHMVEYVVGTARQPTGSVVESEIEAKDLYIRRKPRGVVAVVTPWNFPFAVPLWMLGPSLLEGNTVVFKPSEETPEIGQRLTQLAAEAGFPAGVWNLVHGLGHEAGDALVRHEDVDVVCFTGSYDVGSHIRQVCATSDHKTCACEMGSKSAVIVCDDANLELAVQASVLSAFKTTGQRCVSAGRVLVHKKLVDKFAADFVAKARQLRFGDPFTQGVFAGPLINQASVAKVERYNQLAKDEKAEILLDGGRMRDDEHLHGWFMSPFVYRQDWKPGVRTIREEVFGPHLAIVPFDNDDQAIEIYNDTRYGLSMAVITEDYRRWRRFRDECEFGMGYVNLPCIGAEVHLPFGGVKRSGNGQPSAAALVDSVTHKISFTVNHERGITMAQGMSAKVGDDGRKP